MSSETHETTGQSPARPKARSWWSKLLFWLGGCVIAFLIPFAGMFFAHKAAVSPDGVTRHLWNVIFLFFPLVALAGILTLASPLLLLVAKLRRFAVPALCSSVSFLTGFYCGDAAGLEIRSAAFHALAERSKPLIAAIRQYESEKGNPPPNLDALVPDYLPLTPTTGMGAYPKYEYVVGENAGLYEGNPWVLYVYTPSGGVNFDRFLYFPKQNYPQRGYGGWLERFGEWAYVHE